jgi:hypothetical protein
MNAMHTHHEPHIREGIFPYLDYWLDHGHCVYYNKYIIAFDSFGGILTGLTYLLIPVLLARLVIGNWQALSVKSKGLLMHGGAFILFCGLTHFIDVWNWWHNDYHIAALAKAITGGISAGFVWRTFWFIRNEDWNNPTNP